MDTKKIIPITVISLGLGFLAFQVVKANQKTVTYSNLNTASNVTLYGEPFNAKAIALKLRNAMLPKSMLEGTIENDILELLTGITQLQFYKVILAFGKQNYNPTTGNQYGLIAYDLPYWLKNELGADTNEYKTLKVLFPKYIK